MHLTHRPRRALGVLYVPSRRKRSASPTAGPPHRTFTPGGACAPSLRRQVDAYAGVPSGCSDEGIVGRAIRRVKVGKSPAVTPPDLSLARPAARGYKGANDSPIPNLRTPLRNSFRRMQVCNGTEPFAPPFAPTTAVRRRRTR